MEEILPSQLQGSVALRVTQHGTILSQYSQHIIHTGTLPLSYLLFSKTCTCTILKRCLYKYTVAALFYFAPGPTRHSYATGDVTFLLVTNSPQFKMQHAEPQHNNWQQKLTQDHRSYKQRKDRGDASSKTRTLGTSRWFTSLLTFSANLFEPTYDCTINIL